VMWSWPEVAPLQNVMATDNRHVVLKHQRWTTSLRRKQLLQVHHPQCAWRSTWMRTRAAVYSLQPFNPSLKGFVFTVKRGMLDKTSLFNR
jgi:hypothetical protein